MVKFIRYTKPVEKIKCLHSAKLINFPGKWGLAGIVNTNYVNNYVSCDITRTFAFCTSTYILAELEAERGAVRDGAILGSVQSSVRCHITGRIVKMAIFSFLWRRRCWILAATSLGKYSRRGITDEMQNDFLTVVSTKYFQDKYGLGKIYKIYSRSRPKTSKRWTGAFTLFALRTMLWTHPPFLSIFCATLQHIWPHKTWLHRQLSLTSPH